MKTKQSPLSNIGRIGFGLVATLGLGLTSASALTSVSVPLGGKVIGNGLTINASSALKRLDKATAYTYRIVGTVSCPDTSTTVMSFLVPEPIGLKALLNSFNTNSGNFLQGTYLNPKGKFPIVVYNEVYDKIVPTPLGSATVSLNLTTGVKGPKSPNRVGQVYFKVTNVNIVPPPLPVPVGTLQFDPGSKIVISVKP